jgi:signal transduction histidine kinase
MNCSDLAHQPEKPVNFVEIQRMVSSLLATFDDLKDTVESFQTLLHAQGEQDIDINHVIQRALSLLHPVVCDLRIKIETELRPDLPGVAGSAIRLQQVFLNILLNSIQHMTLKPGRSKVLSITTTYQEDSKDYPLKIRLSDTGPGIHQRLREKVFDLGFTTRPGGTGQGLYIARSVVESLGGRISIERSVVPMGTTFLVELPIALARGEWDEPTTIKSAFS